MKTQIFFLSLLTLLLCSCSSYFKRKDCEAMNWYDYGYQVAMSGKRLSSDNTISECRKVDAAIQESQLDLGFKSGMSNYCKPDIVFGSGKKGQFFNPEFCDPGQVKLLTARHTEGVNVFCEPANGLTFGSAGGTYNQICPKDKEEPFLKEYRKGRKKYLAASISENNRRMQQIDTKLSASTMKKVSLENDVKIIDAVQLVRPANAAAAETDPAETKKRDLRTQINQQENEIRSLNSNKNKLQDEIYSMEKEILTLD